MADPGGTFLGRLGPRALARATPRLTVAVAAAGCALVVLGALVVGGDGLASGEDGSRYPGLLLSAGVLVGGYVVLARFPGGGPLTTAGTVAAALAVPPLLFFLTFDEDGFPPYSTDVILLVSTLVWAGSYLAGPGRGRPFFLGAAAVGLWFAVLQLAEEAFDAPFLFLERFGPVVSSDGTGFESGFGGPDPSAIGGISLAFGAGYLLAARALDRRGYAGVATPVTAAALFALPFGILFLGEDLEALGSGALGAAVGFVVAAHGASVDRRGTTWLGAAGVAFGLLTIVADLVDEATPGGITLMVVGAGVVVGAEALRRATDEAPEHGEPAATGPLEF